jgi:hypothetical protein
MSNPCSRSPLMPAITRQRLDIAHHASQIGQFSGQMPISSGSTWRGGVIPKKLRSSAS